jgi:hypothetical protein
LGNFVLIPKLTENPSRDYKDSRLKTPEKQALVPSFVLQALGLKAADAGFILP